MGYNFSLKNKLNFLTCFAILENKIIVFNF